MILQALYELAKRDELLADPHLERKEIPWLLEITADGNFVGYLPTHEVTGKSKKAKGKSFSVPRDEQRTSQDYPFLFYDNAEYLFGIAEPPKEERAQKRHSLFKERVRKVAQATNDTGALAVERFYANNSAFEEARRKLPPDYDGELIAFKLNTDECLICQRPAILEWWKKQLASQHSQPPADAGFECLVTGTKINSPSNFPKVKGVPGAQPSGATLVSFNFNAAESYYLERNENCPISEEAAVACTRALERLVSDDPKNPANPERRLPRLNLRISADTKLCYWSAKPSVFEGLLGNLLSVNEEGLPQATEQDLGQFLRSIWLGRKPSIQLDAQDFYLMVLSGAQGRIILRDWIETALDALIENIRQHFEDLQLHGLEDRKPTYLSLGNLLNALAHPSEQSGEGIPNPLATALIRAAITGSSYPLAVLVRAAERYRRGLDDDQHRWLNDTRAALIKATLNRKNRGNSGGTWKEVKPMFDPNNHQPGYVLGALLAVLERLQQLAQGDINATLVDRYFSGASATPRTVFVRLLKNARHHASKARQEGNRGLALRLEKLIDELASAFTAPGRAYPANNNFPPYLDLEQQGLFVLGYHQMRKWLWLPEEERRKWEQQHSDAPAIYFWARSQSPVSGELENHDLLTSNS